MPFILQQQSVGNTGLPIDVADTAERLALTPANKMRVEQASDGMVWAYVGATWYPAPILDFDLFESSVLADQVFKSQNQPFGSSGSYIVLSVPTTILPAQAFCDYAASFIGSGTVTIADSGVTYIDANYVYSKFSAQIQAGNACSITLDCSLLAGNVSDILAAIDTYPAAISGTLTLTGSNEPPTPRVAVSLPFGVFSFGGDYPVGPEYNGQPTYIGYSTEFPYDNFEIRWDGAGNKWEIWNITQNSNPCWSAGSEVNPWDVTTWLDWVGAVGFIAIQSSLQNAALVSLISRGLTVYTN